MSSDATVNELAAKVQIDFHCLEEGCAEVVKFNVTDIVQEDFQAVCPKCHHAYQFDAALQDKLSRMLDLIKAIRRSEDILGDALVSVNVAGGEVRVPYALLLTRLNTLITLDLGGKKVDFHLWIAPSSPETFR